jgi:hypothetical protein
LDSWTNWLRTKKEHPQFSDVYTYLSSVNLPLEQEQALQYLCRTEATCGSCPASLKYLKTLQVQIEELEAEREFFEQHENMDAFFETRLSKNSDINKLAVDFQTKFGCCGRDTSKKTMATADVVIFTYNWLLDPQIAKHAMKALKLETNALNPTVAAICDESQFLFDYNEQTEFDFNSLFDAVSYLWNCKYQYLIPREFHVPQMGEARALNPHYLGSMNRDFDGMNAENFDDTDLGSIWNFYEINLRTFATIFEKLNLMLADSTESKSNPQPTPQKLFQLLTGTKTSWFPRNLYSLFSAGLDLDSVFTSDPIKTSYESLDRLIAVCERIKVNLSHWDSESFKAVNDIFDDLAKGKDPQIDQKWLKIAVEAWQIAGSHNRLGFKRQLMSISNGVYENLLKVHEFVYDFLLIARECIYSIGTGQFNDRVLSISQYDNYSFLKAWDIFNYVVKPDVALEKSIAAKEMSHYLGVLAQVAQSEHQTDFNKLAYDDLINFFSSSKHSSMINLKLKKQYAQSLLASFKVNRPFIQTALRPYSYLTFLTGTAPESNFWKAKSGFRYLTTSQYPLVPKSFDIEIDDRSELKTATKTPAMMSDLAFRIQQYTQRDKTLVGYPSKATMKAIVEHFPEDYKSSIILENENLALEDIQAYFETVETGSVHVIISGKYTEGVEYSDAIGSSLVKRAIVVGVPFNPPSEELTQTEEYFAKQFGWDKWSLMKNFMYAPVYRKVRQFIGRTVRNLTDHGTIILMDSRYKTSKMLREALRL